MRRSFKKRTARKLLQTKEEGAGKLDTAPMDIEEKVAFIREGLFLTDDLSIREMVFNQQVMNLVFIDSTVDVTSIQSNVIKPIQEQPYGEIWDVVIGAKVTETDDLTLALDSLVDGKCLLIQEKDERMYLIAAPKDQSNHRIEPMNEKVIRGSHQGFSENIKENVQFIRERIINRKVTVKYSHVGEMTKTKYALVSISTLTDPALLKTIEDRIKTIKADTIQSPGYFEEFLEDNSFSPFPQFLNTERPDRVVANLMEGRIALLMEGSPTALILPVSFFSFFQTSEDYNSRFFISSFLRMVRLVSFITTLCLPAFYIAVISYNYEVIPVEIIFSIKSSLEYLPFPPLIEAVIMQFTLELLREAAIRLPNPVAQTIGVVGGLVIGSAVVEANFVSNTMVIVVAITAISSFVIPSNELSTTLRILGFPLMVMASLFGFFGIVIGLMLTLIHMSKLKSLGHYYLYPIAPLDVKALKDTVIRVPIWFMKQRPKDLKALYNWKTTNPRGWKKND
ncbi:spore germination protein [Bacillus sp. KH172YL63]|uniref:spore germination protein n=1 Tax=Bacillus sp. KH172YL63 TaxID=2709784 RepID=UPI0013E4A0B3|nr:spore germination protein [Bacillus sp. KH172YL63]BCB04320.1 germination protein KA [Bacillus sp. KH172YL63]